jgi:DNA-directed RNA polymerase subunit RPC12/RpoP
MKESAKDMAQQPLQIIETLEVYLKRLEVASANPLWMRVWSCIRVLREAVEGPEGARVADVLSGRVARWWYWCPDCRRGGIHTVEPKPTPRCLNCDQTLIWNWCRFPFEAVEEPERNPGTAYDDLPPINITGGLSSEEYIQRQREGSLYDEDGSMNLAPCPTHTEALDELDTLLGDLQSSDGDNPKWLAIWGCANRLRRAAEGLDGDRLTDDDATTAKGYQRYPYWCPQCGRVETRIYTTGGPAVCQTCGTRVMSQFKPRLSDVTNEPPEVTIARLRGHTETNAQLAAGPGHWKCDRMDCHTMDCGGPAEGVIRCAVCGGDMTWMPSPQGYRRVPADPETYAQAAASPSATVGHWRCGCEDCNHANPRQCDFGGTGDCRGPFAWVPDAPGETDDG